jgi:RNA polymerase sigma factor (sigma-70 family)
VRRFSPRIRAVARDHRLGSIDAEDVVQATWLELLKYIGRIRDPTALGAWLHRTARRESLRAANVRRREDPVERLPTEPAIAPEGPARLEAAERSAALTGALQSLPRRDRELMRMLAGDDDASYTEISEALDMPVGSIGPTRARCLARLRQNRRLALVA